MTKIERLQEELNARYASRKPSKKRVSLTIKVSNEAKKRKFHDIIGDIFRNEGRHENWMRGWKKKEKKNT